MIIRACEITEDEKERLEKIILEGNCDFLTTCYMCPIDKIRDAAEDSCINEKEVDYARYLLSMAKVVG